MEAKIETPRRVETIIKEIEESLTTNPMYNFHGTKWFEKTHTQHFWNTQSNTDWLTEEGFKTAHYRRTLLNQEKRKVQDLQHWANTKAEKLAEDVLEEKFLVTLEVYDKISFFDEEKTLKEWNADNRLALAKKVLEASIKARFRRWDYQVLKSLKVTG